MVQTIREFRAVVGLLDRYEEALRTLEKYRTISKVSLYFTGHQTMDLADGPVRVLAVALVDHQEGIVEAFRRELLQKGIDPGPPISAS
jgi:tRNA (Thr-GGU) A37 N-methylase